MASSWIQVTNVSIKGQNPAPLNSIFSFEVSFVCTHDLAAPLEWRLIYVCDPKDKSQDQEIECVEIFPVRRGAMKFTFESDPPDFSKINPDEIWGTTVILLEASYRTQEFVRIGWYVYNIYADPALQEDPPDLPLLDQLQRYIDPSELRVTRFNIEWEKGSESISGEGHESMADTADGDPLVRQSVS